MINYSKTKILNLLIFSFLGIQIFIYIYNQKPLTNNFSQEQIIEYNIQFSSITNIGDELTCSAKVVKIVPNGTRKELKLELNVADQHNDLKLKGYSLIKIL